MELASAVSCSVSSFIAALKSYSKNAQSATEQHPFVIAPFVHIVRSCIIHTTKGEEFGISDHFTDTHFHETEV